ncbi:hypothetical protein [Novosphingobium sp. P6W]|uniref:hypothetical protein n=1 Tax=Novosphingobium sp. P6W TaxID=1609758 RepID=UPI0005C2E10E|nr:hypothetical protein [Novosphingobium sp. P6W]AXB75513.1 hypothetical protein TQ38_002460 [Novosphingobium sp. P6W]KIS32471.1 hypothetical protein TQ38_08985 [Novosphingobium sp. P6W]
MSGPKVVRIVTREEIIELCRGHLARVDAALEEWIRVGRRNECLDEDAIAAATRRRDALAALIAADRFQNLQKQAPDEIAYLQQNMQTRLAEVVARQALARTREKREKQASETLLNRLHSAGITLDPALELQLKRCEPGAVGKAFSLLADAQSQATASNALAVQLGEGERKRTFSDWLAGQEPIQDEDPAIEKLQARIDELCVLLDPSDIAVWRSRLLEAGSAPVARRNLVLDGLDIETGRVLSQARTWTKLVAEYRMVCAELAEAGVENSEVPYLEFTAGRQDDLQESIDRSRSLLEQHRAKRAADARRAAVLEGLAGLGYEVSQGMSTSLAEEGRLVVRSMARPDYGVEVAVAAERMQMRPVAFESAGQGPPTSRDRDAETIWCGDVSVLQAKLAALGGQLAIEKSLPIGATPLKRVAIAGQDSVAAAEVPVLKGRTLR